ncbi:MAG: sulfotransferase [Nitrospirota bacterium]
MSSKVIIIAGMHRSGTSLTTDLLRNMGVNIGNELLKVDSSNQFGFWEDMDFLGFHENLFKKRRSDYLVISPELFMPDEEETAYAKELIQKKSSQPLWGWKDPRTSLFLDFWHQLIPSANFIFVYRHPMESVLSLMKAAHRPIVLNPGGGFTSWKIYNECILRFFEKHREKAILCHIHGIVQNYDVFLNLASEKFDLTRMISLEKIYHPGSLTSLPVPDWFNMFLKERYPGVLELYNKLQENADLPFQDVITGNLSDEQTMIFMDYTIKSLSGIYNRLWEWHHQLRDEKNQIQEELNRIEQTRDRLLVKELEKHPRLMRLASLIFDAATKVYRLLKRSTKR